MGVVTIHITLMERSASSLQHRGALLSWTLQSVYLSYTRAKKIITVVTKSLEKPLKRQFFIGSKLLTDVNLTFGGTLKLSWSLSLSRLCIASSCCADQRCLRPSLWTEEASQIKKKDEVETEKSRGVECSGSLLKITQIQRFLSPF